MSLPALNGKTALVTGASRGLGLEIARHLAAAGADVAMIAKNPAALSVAREQVQMEHPQRRIIAHAADLADVAAIDVLLAALNPDLPTIDILVNNAGVQGPIGPLEKIDFAAWRQVFETNFFAAARLTQLLIPRMRSSGRGGKIINISGGGATGPRPDFSAYAAAKTALVRLSETLAEELKPDAIDVNAVAPGAMNTRMLEEVLAAGRDAAPREYDAAVKRTAEGGVPPAKAAETVVFLASPASNGITGKLISAVWDDWAKLPARREALANSDVYTLRRIVPKDRGLGW
jgi:NAD(P)-dependent dehydrogenase (short-subunit alcohol dehydrogenase family)